MALPVSHPGLRLLIAAGRLSLDATGRASTLYASPEDWQTAAACAERHGMSWWLSEAVRSCRDTPPAVRAQVRSAAHAQAARALRAVVELSRAVTSLRAGGVEVVALKGPLFSRWLYGDVGARRFGDLDLLVDVKDRARAVELLRPIGYTLPRNASQSAASVIYAGVGAWPLDHPSACALDLHWQLQARRFGSPLTTAEVIHASVVTREAGCDVRIPSPTDAATLALVHAAKHTWTSLETVLAIAHLMRRDDVDWARVRSLTGKSGTWSGAAAGLALAVELFDSEMPAALRDIPRRSAAAHLRRAAHQSLAAADADQTTRIAEFRTHCGALDTRRGRLRYAAWRLFAPTPLELSWRRLPDRLAILYVPLRLVRLSVVAARGFMSTIASPR